MLLLDAEQASARLARTHGGFDLLTRSCGGFEASTIAREIAALGGATKRCLTLALGAGWVSVSTVDLPVMQRGELSKVLLRRAAKLSGLAPTDVLFGARCLGPAAHPDQESKELRYLLAATSRARIQPLQRELRRRGHKLAAIMPARLARLSFALERLETQAGFAEQRSAIVVDVEAHAVAFSLLVGELILSQSVLEGDLMSVPTLPLSMLQELKNMDAFHRKARRGAGVACVSVIGLSPERAQLFATAARASLPNAAIRFEPSGDAEFDGAQALDISLLAAAHEGVFSLDLRAPTPWGTRERAVLAAGSTLAVVGLAGVVMQDISSDARRAEVEAERALRLGRDGPELAQRELAAEQVVLQLEQQLEQLCTIASTGFEPGELLTRIGGCLPVDVLPWSFSVTAPELDGALRIEGSVCAEPLRAFLALEELRTRLEALPELAAVSIEPQAVLASEGEAASRVLNFQLRAMLRRAGP